MHRLARLKTQSVFSCGILFGDVLLLRPGDVHSFLCCNKLRLYNVMFMPGLLEADNDALRKLPGLRALFEEAPSSSFKLCLTSTALSSFASNAKKLMRELSERKSGYRLAAKAGLLEMLVAIGRAEPRNQGKKQSEDSSEFLFKQQAVNKAICLMEESLNGELSLELLAKEAGISSSYLSHIFKEALGLAPWDYLLRLRLEKAKALLSKPALSIGEIAVKSGFCDGSHLAKCFKALEGCSPRKFRNSMIKAGL